MNPSNKDDWDISFCGLNCAHCEIYFASHGDEKLQKELTKWFKENIDPNIKNVKCERCRGPEHECWSKKCELRDCAIKMNVEYCFECQNFVCTKLDKFANMGIEHHKRTIENMKEMKKYGLNKWISIQNRPSFCP
ncbi:MAG: DUF3795 domain-containing protein [Candidatus Thorarchaeota archaeon]